MTITRYREGSKLTLILDGWLDTANAPKLYDELGARLNGVTHLVLDMKLLQYLSTAGLRVVLAAQKAGIAAARAGMPGRELDAAARKVIEEAGYGDYFTHSFGHSLGLEIHESPNASPSETGPLPAGTVISAEPGIYLPGRFGVRIEDVLVLEEGGCRDITQSPKNLIVL